MKFPTIVFADSFIFRSEGKALDVVVSNFGTGAGLDMVEEDSISPADCISGGAQDRSVIRLHSELFPGSSSDRWRYKSWPPKRAMPSKRKYRGRIVRLLSLLLLWLRGVNFRF